MIQQARLSFLYLDEESSRGESQRMTFVDRGCICSGSHICIFHIFAIRDRVCVIRQVSARLSLEISMIQSQSGSANDLS